MAAIAAAFNVFMPWRLLLRTNWTSVAAEVLMLNIVSLSLDTVTEDYMHIFSPKNHIDWKVG